MSFLLQDDTEPIDVSDHFGYVDDLLQVEIEPAEVLVVDDVPTNLRALEATLEGLGTRVIGVTSGSAALREVLRRNIALILLDVQLPAIDGFEIARVIRSRERSQHIPIIFLTAHSHDEVDIRRGYELGAVDYLFKPVGPDVLRAKVLAFVQLRNRTAQVQAQALRLQELERAESKRRLEEARRVWEADLMRRQMEELEQADRRKDEFLAVLAHELRNPLTPIVTGLEVVRQASDDSPVVDQACAAMSRQVQHLVRLVDDLLDVSRISRGKVTLRRQPVDVRGCITQAVETCASAVDAARHTLHLSLPSEPLASSADPVRITQVVSNLISNAVRYTDPGGTIEVEALAESGEIVVRVRDNGRGIAKDMLDRVFGMFVQERSEGKGLGLGLTLVEQVVQLHGGRVEARSEGPGTGSEFEVRLPRLVGDALAAEIPMAPSVAHGDQPSLCILLVDDEADIATTTGNLLQSWGHRVHVASSGREGISLACTIQPDLILLDIGLPDLDGYEVADAIRRDGVAKRAYLVAITGFGQVRDKERAAAAGFDDHIVKPVAPDRLQAALLECTHATSPCGGRRGVSA